MDGVEISWVGKKFYLQIKVGEPGTTRIKTATILTANTVVVELE